jgi:hypothetical protein
VILCDRAFNLRKRSDRTLNAEGMSGSIARVRALPDICRELGPQYPSIRRGAPPIGTGLRDTMPSVHLEVE